MGIDRSNIRFVLHTAMPKSIEHYQQETGRAGRDGLEAECVLLYSGRDLMTWKSIMTKSAAEAGASPEYLASAMQHLDHMDRYARGAVCRHKSLVQYFGQNYEPPSCHACDLCLSETENVPGAQATAQKILSCVARVRESFGINHVVGVLRGENTENIRKRGHDQLSTFGLLRDHGKVDVRDWVYQLLGQNVLLQVGDEYPLLKLNDASWEVMKGKRPVRLVRMARHAPDEPRAKTQAETTSWEGVDRELFDALRGLRKQVADERQVPPYIVFTDATLRELARVRPSTLDRMRLISGIGDAKLREFGDRFLQLIEETCAARGLDRDKAQAPPLNRPDMPRNPVRPTLQREQAFQLFRKEIVIEDVMHQTGKARSTVSDYLCQFIREEKPASIATWVPKETYDRVAAAAQQVGTERLKPIYLALEERVTYDQIRLVLAHLTASG
jgi:ATP-dependent DNA helicase RecQ